MSLEGSIKDFGLSDIFQLILIQQKSGIMSIRGQSRRASVGFVKGMVVSAQVDDKEGVERIGEVLVRAKRVTPQQLTEALKAQQETGNYLGQVLVERQVISEPDLKKALRLQILESVYRLFRWQEGRYSFDQRDVEYPKGWVDPISTEHVLMEGVRRLDEWPYIEKKIPSMAMVFGPVESKREEVEAAAATVKKPAAPSDDPFADLDLEDSGRFSTDEITVYHAINGRDAVARIIELVQLGEFEVCKALSNLATAGLIVPVVDAPARTLSEWSPAAARAVSALVATGWWSVNLALVAVLLAVPVIGIWAERGRILALLAEDQRAVRALLLTNHLNGLRELVNIWSLEHGRLPENLFQPLSDYGAAAWPLKDPWDRDWRYDPKTGSIHTAGPDGRAGTADDL